ncbi:uncharacterized protein BCR38DRAFT_432170 [Pseudomassariella vexata]|uniref:Secreted protein n=1 Tax=Pseudomassariella vexata TaxID=1141098 RepID=A0A1Y2E109_9PEZI|nr:uncharacterized protein BCR38DRAFT_432170 [Pseudomassariella vexata]ORY65228.1 hypothetical protein BCR38DRAFT_432170 [Pseudomassariella vexata]
MPFDHLFFLFFSAAVDRTRGKNCRTYRDADEIVSRDVTRNAIVDDRGPKLRVRNSSSTVAGRSLSMRTRLAYQEKRAGFCS